MYSKQKNQMGAETIICNSKTSYEKQIQKSFNKNLDAKAFIKKSKKETLYDRDEFKLIDRVCKLRETNPNIKVGEIQRPIMPDEVFEVEVQF